MAKHDRHSVCIAVFLKRDDCAVLELNKVLPIHLEIAVGVFLGPVLQASNL